MCAWSEVLHGFCMGTGIAAARKTLEKWSHPPGLNRRPADYESDYGAVPCQALQGLGVSF